MDCVKRFIDVHKICPQRVFLVHVDTPHQLNMEACKSQLFSMKSDLTYITLFNKHQIRSFIQHDSNYLARDSVKKAQLTAHTIINEVHYLQLEFERPPYRVEIHSNTKSLVDKFDGKVIELLSKVATGSAVHTYGSGLGIFDFASKLNKYRNYNL